MFCDISYIQSDLVELCLVLWFLIGNSVKLKANLKWCEIKTKLAFRDIVWILYFPKKSCICIWNGENCNKSALQTSNMAPSEEIACWY